MRQCQPSALARDVASALNIVLPTALANTMEYLPAIAAIVILGRHSGDTTQTALELDAFSLARVYINSVAIAPGFGYITALRTLCPQAVGAGKPELCALYIQRAIAIVIVGFLPAVPLILFSSRVLKALGQPEAIADLAQPLILRLAPQYMGYVCMSALQRVYQAEGLNWSNFLITVVVATVSVPLIWFFVELWGVRGAAWACSLWTSCYLLLQIPHLCATGRAYLFTPLPPSRVFERSGLSEYLRLMAPGFVMQVLEWWIQEAVVLLAGLLHHPEVTLGAMTLTTQFQALGVMTWIGLAVAGSTLVGHRIGAGQPLAARRAAVVVVILGLLLACVFGSLLATLPRQLASLCTTVPSIRRLSTKLLPVVGGVMIADATSNGLGGVCSGLGLQKYAAIAQLAGYGIGMPVGALLAFGALGGGEEGAELLWAGIGLSMICAAFVMLLQLVRHDWQRSADEANARLGMDGEADQVTHAPVTSVTRSASAPSSASMAAAHEGTVQQEAEPVRTAHSVMGRQRLNAPLLSSSERASSRVSAE